MLASHIKTLVYQATAADVKAASGTIDLDTTNVIALFVACNITVLSGGTVAFSMVALDENNNECYSLPTMGAALSAPGFANCLVPESLVGCLPPKCRLKWVTTAAPATATANISIYGRVN